MVWRTIAHTVFTERNIALGSRTAIDVAIRQTV